jgi:hypothetical protein
MSPLDGLPDASGRHHPPGPMGAAPSPEDTDWCSLWPEPGAPLPAAEHAIVLAAIAANVANARRASVVTLRTRLWAYGYRPVAVRNAVKGDSGSGKAPLAAGWPERARHNPPADAAEPPDARALNTGILADGLRLVDGDIDEPALAHRIRALACSHFGPTIRRSRITSPRFALLYRASEGEPAKRVVTSAEGKGSIEILGRGQQFVAYGQHHSGAPLCWPDGAPDATPVDELPAVTEDAVAAFLAEASPLIGAKPPQAAKATGEWAPSCRAEKRADRPADTLDRYNEAALDDAVRAIVEAPDGQQRNTINRECFSIATLVAGAGMPASLALQALHWAAGQVRSHNPHRLWRPRELEKKVDIAFRDGLRHSRGPRHG